MFEDIIEKKDIRSVCPYCKSWKVTKYGLRRTINGGYEQEVQCNGCSKTWYVIYDEDMNEPRIREKTCLKT